MKRTIHDTDHESFRASVREFLDREVTPYAEEHATVIMGLPSCVGIHADIVAPYPGW
jgi:hypothetical protein